MYKISLTEVRKRGRKEGKVFEKAEEGKPTVFPGCDGVHFSQITLYI